MALQVVPKIGGCNDRTKFPIIFILSQKSGEFRAVASLRNIGKLSRNPLINLIPIYLGKHVGSASKCRHQQPLPKPHPRICGDPGFPASNRIFRVLQYALIISPYFIPHFLYSSSTLCFNHCLVSIHTLVFYPIQSLGFPHIPTNPRDYFGSSL